VLHQQDGTDGFCQTGLAEIVWAIENVQSRAELDIGRSDAAKILDCEPNQTQR